MLEASKAVAVLAVSVGGVIEVGDGSLVGTAVGGASVGCCVGGTSVGGGVVGTAVSVGCAVFVGFGAMLAFDFGSA